MSKYSNGVFFSSSYATISPPSTSFDMARSSSRDSTSHYYPTSHPMSQSSSTASSVRYQPTSIAMRRTSSSSSSQSTWSASPYRSCLNRSTPCEEATSYLSDDDLLNLSLPVETIPNPCMKKELSTEEQIARLRERQQAEEHEQRQRRDSGYQSTSASRRKTVRFEPEVQRKPQRPTGKGKSPTYRKQLGTLNGPM